MSIHATVPHVVGSFLPAAVPFSALALAIVHSEEKKSKECDTQVAKPYAGMQQART